MDFRSFFGILPPRILYKDLSSAVESIPLPGKVTLLWPGKDASFLKVRVGEEVKTGQNLAKQKEMAFICPVTGQVDEIFTLPSIGRGEDLAVNIRTDQKDSYDTLFEPVEDFSKLKPMELRALIMEAGFDTLSSISSVPSTWPHVDCLIISALDMDPISCTNRQALQTSAQHLPDAVQLLSLATGASKCILAIPDDMMDQVPDSLPNGCMVASIANVYPNGLQEVLAKDHGAGRLMEADGNGIRGNTVVVGAEHALAMAVSLRQGRPFVEKLVTVAGHEEAELKTFKVRIGTPISHVLKQAGLSVSPKGKLIVNGMMKGYACFSDQQPVTSSTHCIHVQSQEQVFFYDEAQCINCGKCDAICPMDLAVGLLGRMAEYGKFEDCKELGAQNCIYCGLCAYVCPAKRPLVHFISNATHAIWLEESQARKDFA